jgi:tRNA-dihydrouridine synthase B
MRDEPLALAIVEAVVGVCAPRGVPVTLKMRTGWSAQHRNAPRIAQAAEQAGVAMLTVHGRTREQGYGGAAEHHTVAAIKQAVRIPVVANGDIDTPQKAREVFECTGVDAVMIGRAAQGRPWIFGEIAHFLDTGTERPPPAVSEVAGWLGQHLLDHYSLYGEFAGVRTARKHIGWAVKALPGGEAFRQRINLIDDCQHQHAALADFLAELATHHPRWPAIETAPPAAANDDHLLQHA